MLFLLSYGYGCGDIDVVTIVTSVTRTAMVMVAMMTVAVVVGICVLLMSSYSIDYLEMGLFTGAGGVLGAAGNLVGDLTGSNRDSGGGGPLTYTGTEGAAAAAATAMSNGADAIINAGAKAGFGETATIASGGHGVLGGVGGGSALGDVGHIIGVDGGTTKPTRCDWHTHSNCGTETISPGSEQTLMRMARHHNSHTYKRGGTSTFHGDVSSSNTTNYSRKHR